MWSVYGRNYWKCKSLLFSFPPVMLLIARHMVTSQFNKISPLNHDLKGIFDVLPPARECLPFNLGKCKQSKHSRFLRVLKSLIKMSVLSKGRVVNSHIFIILLNKWIYPAHKLANTFSPCSPCWHFPADGSAEGEMRKVVSDKGQACLVTVFHRPETLACSPPSQPGAWTE